MITDTPLATWSRGNVRWFTKVRFAFVAREALRTTVNSLDPSKATDISENERRALNDILHGQEAILAYATESRADEAIALMRKLTKTDPLWELPPWDSEEHIEDMTQALARTVFPDAPLRPRFSLDAWSVLDKLENLYKMDGVQKEWVSALLPCISPLAFVWALRNAQIYDIQVLEKEG